jgi:MerR family transcriptional regulator/heat shock protein HspR
VSVLRSFDDEHLPLYTVGQVADVLGVQPAYLRRLDAEDVVSPRRSNGGQRRYSRLEIALIEHVNLMVGDGMTLAGIRRILELEAEVADLQAQLVALGGGVRQRPVSAKHDGTPARLGSSARPRPS